MARKNTGIKPIAYAIAIFLTLGVTIANVTLSRFGLASNYLIVFSMAFMLAVFLIGQSVWLVLAVATGLLLVNQPETLLISLNLDRDLLLAALGALIVVPVLYKQLAR